MTKTAYITGWSGFVGRHLTKHLQDSGYEVDGCDLHDWKHVDAMHIFTSAVPSMRYDLVVHCAAWVGGRANIDGVNTNAAKNLALDGAFFDWVSRFRQPNVIYFSSSAVYPVRYQTRSMDPIRLMESDVSHYGDEVLVPDAHYGWGKLTAERYLVPMARELGSNVNVLRPFSGYGETQDLNYPFPAIMLRAHRHVNGTPFEVWGPEGQTRDWVHIDDLVRATRAIAEGCENEVVNVCTGQPTTFGELASLALHCAGKVGPITYNDERPTGVYWRVGNPTRLRTIYQPKITIQEGVERAIKRLRDG